MKPGRELDALIAEKIMGWKNVRSELSNPHDDESWIDWVGNPPLKEGDDGTRYGLRTGKCCPVCNHHDDVTRPIKVEFEREATVPAYSSRIQDAWLVVDKIREDRLSVFKLSRCVGPGYLCTFYSEPKEYGETAAHAICLAALNADNVHSQNTEKP